MRVSIRARQPVKFRALHEIRRRAFDNQSSQQNNQPFSFRCMKLSDSNFFSRDKETNRARRSCSLQTDQFTVYASVTCAYLGRQTTFRTTRFIFGMNFLVTNFLSLEEECVMIALCSWIFATRPENPSTRLVAKKAQGRKSWTRKPSVKNARRSIQANKRGFPITFWLLVMIQLYRIQRSLKLKLSGRSWKRNEKEENKSFPNLAIKLGGCKQISSFPWVLAKL